MVLRAWRLDLHIDAEMMNLGIKPGVITRTTLIEAITKHSVLMRLRNVFQEMKRHRMLA